VNEKRSIVLIANALLSWCNKDDADERFDVGYSDGYTVGNNTECQIRATLIESDFDDEDYSRGYTPGMVYGKTACRNGD